MAGRIHIDKRVFVNLFIALYLLILLAYAFPFWRVTAQARDKLAWIAICLGLDQYWMMFAPVPGERTIAAKFFVAMDDGFVAVYEPPRMPYLSLWDRFRRERLRKFFVDNFMAAGARIMLPTTARFIVHALDTPGWHPRKVSILLQRAEISSFDNPTPHGTISRLTQSSFMYSYRPTKEDLHY